LREIQSMSHCTELLLLVEPIVGRNYHSNSILADFSPSPEVRANLASLTD
jgi:hypothetical protein